MVVERGPDFTFVVRKRHTRAIRVAAERKTGDQPKLTACSSLPLASAYGLLVVGAFFCGWSSDLGGATTVWPPGVLTISLAVSA